MCYYFIRVLHLDTDTVASVPLTVAVPQNSKTQCFLASAAIDRGLPFADHTCPSSGSGPISGGHIAHLLYKVSWKVT